MCKDEKYSDECGMEFERFSFSFWSSDESHVYQSNSEKWNNSEKIESNCNYIGNATPCACGSERDNGREKEIEKYSDKVDSSSDSCEFTESSDVSCMFSSEENDEFSDGNRLREDDRYRHKKNEIPRLIGSKKLHIVSHVHKKEKRK